jgi:hypothetical protein
VHVTAVQPARQAVAVEVPPTTPAGTSRTGASTTARLTSSLIALLVLTIAFGLAGAIGASQRSSLVGSVRNESGPLALDATLLYRALSDADATASEEFLYSSQQSPNPADLAALRTRYLGDISAASANLTALSSGRIDSAALRSLAAGLPIYTGLVETARADSRLGLPLGAAYLREASSQMRTVLLVAAKSLYDAESSQLGTDRGKAAGFPWLAIPLGLLLLAGLIAAQRTMALRTHRAINLGLAVATLTTLITLGWILISWSSEAGHVHRSDNAGSSQVDAYANARIDLLRARADEELTLIARGNDPSFDSDYKTMIADATKLLNAAPPTGAEAALADWQREDTAMRKPTISYQDAVTLTVGPDSTDAPALFNAVDTKLGAAIDSSNATFQIESSRAAGSLSGLWIDVTVLTVIALAGLLFGFERRLAEYR